MKGLSCLLAATLVALSESKMVPYDSKFAVGMGVNSATMAPKSPKCVKGATGAITRHDAVRETEDWYSGALKTTMEFKGVSSTLTLHKELSFALTGSVAVGSFGGGVSSSVSNDMILSEYEAAYVLKVVVEKAQVTRFDASENVIWDEELNEHPHLADLCGDSFVESIQGGGVFYAIFKTSKSSYSKSENSATDVSAHGWGVALESEINKTYKEEQGTEGSKITILQLGGSGADWQEGSVFDIAGLKAKALAFPAAVQKNPWNFRMNIKPWGSYFVRYAPAVQVDFLCQKQQLDHIREKSLQIVSMLKTAEFALQNQCMFGANFIDWACVQEVSDLARDAGQTCAREYHLLTADLNYQPAMILVPDAQCLPGIPRPDEYVGCFADKQITMSMVDAWQTDTDAESYDHCKDWARKRKLEYFGFGGTFPNVKKGRSVCYALKQTMDEDFFEEASMMPRFGYSQCGAECKGMPDHWCGSSKKHRAKAIYRMVKPLPRNDPEGIVLLEDSSDTTTRSLPRGLNLGIVAFAALAGMVLLTVLPRRFVKKAQETSQVELIEVM